MSKANGTLLEGSIRRIGEAIFQRAADAAPSVFSLEHWQQAALGWLTRDDSLKQRLFGFMADLPGLADSPAVARRLHEALEVSNGDAALPPGLALVASAAREGSLTAGWVGALARSGCLRVARQFISGSTPEEAIEAVLRLRRAGMAFTLDVLGESVRAEATARAHQELYIRLVEHLAADASRWPGIPSIDEAPWGTLPRVNISIKLSAIVPGFDGSGRVEAVLERLRPILRAGRDRRAFINIDMEQYSVKDLTLEAYRRVLMEPEFREWPDCGIVIQAYLRDGYADMAGLIDWARRRGTPITVRLVKGAYWDSEVEWAGQAGRPSPVFTMKRESDASFERVAGLMLSHAEIIRPAFASHNVRSIAAALAMEAALGLPSRTLEVQMLTGMGDPLKRALVSMGQRLRVYAPFGELMTGMAYLIRRLIENTANESFLRQSFGPDAPLDRLLQSPAPSPAIPDSLSGTGG